MGHLVKTPAGMLRFSDAGSSFLFRLYQTMGGFSNTTPNFDRRRGSVNHQESERGAVAGTGTVTGPVNQDGPSVSGG